MEKSYCIHRLHECAKYKFGKHATILQKREKKKLKNGMKIGDDKTHHLPS